MRKGSKKGACSAHIQAAKGNCLEHARRDYGEKNRPQYILTKRSADNVTVYEHEAIKDRKSIRPLVRQAEKLYTEKTGQKCQKSFSPYREDVLSLPGRGDITREQLMSYKTKVEAATGWQCMGMWYHKDEGFVKSKHIEGSEGEAINYHVHCLWYCQDSETGKAKRNDRKFFSLRQDWLAEATGMERGNKAAETGIKGRTAMEQRIFSQEARIDDLERLAKEREEAYRKEMERLEEEKKKAVEEAKATAWKEVAKSAKGVANLFGRDKEVNNLKEEVESLKSQIIAAEKEKKNALANSSAKTEELRQENQKLQEKNAQMRGDYLKKEKKLQGLIDILLSIPIIRECIKIIRSFVRESFLNSPQFNPKETSLLSTVMGDESIEARKKNAENLHTIASKKTNLCGSQYMSGWSDVKEALMDIAEFKNPAAAQDEQQEISIHL